MKFTVRDAMVVTLTVLTMVGFDWVTGSRAAVRQYWVAQFVRMQQEVDPKQGWRRAQSDGTEALLRCVCGEEAAERYRREVEAVGKLSDHQEND